MTTKQQGAGENEGVAENAIRNLQELVNGRISFTLFILAVLLSFQVYWAIGNQLTSQLDDLLLNEKYISNQLDENQKEYFAIENRYKQAEYDSADFNGTYTYKSSPEWERETLENTTEKSRLETDWEALKSQLDRNSALLLVWSKPWSGLFPEQDIVHSDKYAQEFEQIDTRIDEIKKQLAKDPSGIKAAEGQKSSLEAQLVYLDEELAKATKEEESAIREERKVVEDKIILVRQKTELENQIKGLDIERQDAQAKIDDLVVKIANLNEQIIALDIKEQDVQKQITAKLTQNIDRKNQLADLQSKLTGLQAQKLIVEPKISGSQPAQKANLEKELQGIEIETESTQATINSLNTQILSEEQLNAQTGELQNQIDGIDSERSSLQKQMNVLTVNKNTLDGKVIEIDNKKQEKQKKVEGLQAQIENLKNVVTQGDFGAKIVEQLAMEKVYWDEKRTILESKELAEAKPEQTRQAALQALLAGRFVLVILQSYILPVLYGVLGASSFVLRNLSQQTGSSLSNEASRQHMLRISLGALAGIMVGWFSFLIPNESNSFFGSVSPLAIAFIVGYNIEIFFAFMDLAIARFTGTLDQQRNLLASNKDDEGAPVAGKPNPKKTEPK